MVYRRDVVFFESENSGPLWPHLAGMYWLHTELDGPYWFGLMGCSVSLSNHINLAPFHFSLFRLGTLGPILKPNSSSRVSFCPDSAVAIHHFRFALSPLLSSLSLSLSPWWRGTLSISIFTFFFSMMFYLFYRSLLCAFAWTSKDNSLLIDAMGLLKLGKGLTFASVVAEILIKCEERHGNTRN